MNEFTLQAREKLQIAINYCGSQSELARKLSEILNKKIIQTTVRKWLTSTQKIPDYACRPIEKITGGLVKAHELRPDLWDPPTDVKQDKSEQSNAK